MYNQKFKNNIINLYHQGESIEELSKKFNVSKSSIYSWTSSNHSQDDNNSLTKLQKQNKKLLEENHILKKAIVIMSASDYSIL